MRIVEILSSNPKERGQQHGETLREWISEIAEFRMETHVQYFALQTHKRRACARS